METPDPLEEFQRLNVNITMPKYKKAILDY